MTLIRIQPDTEYTEQWLTIGFEVDAEATAALRDPLATTDHKIRADRHVKAMALQAIQRVEANPKLAEWEVSRKVNARNLQRDFSQETVEEMEERRIARLPSPTVTDVMKRGKENWTIEVWGRRKNRLFLKYPELRGPDDGYESYDRLPEDIKARMKPVYEEKGA